MAETVLPTMEDLYPNGRGYHQAHEPYLNAVADGFEAAGIAVVTWYADPNDPRDGGIQIDPQPVNSGADEVWVCWQEERRWYILTEHQMLGRREPVKVIEECICDTVASPETVVRATLEHFGVSTDAIRADDYPDEDFPEHEFETGNVALELALRRYRSEGMPS